MRGLEQDSAVLGRGMECPAKPQFAKIAAVCYVQGMLELSPLVSEFATTEEAEAYDRWLRTQVQASLDDPLPPIPHDEAMSAIRVKVAIAKQEQQAQ
jgi:hypothetical protein